MTYLSKEKRNAHQRQRYAEDPDFRASIAKRQRNDFNRIRRHSAWRERNPEKVRLYNHRWESRNKEKARSYRNKWQNAKRARMRLEAIEKYGGRCVYCGEDNEVFLAFDHVNGGGVQHMKLLKSQHLSHLGEMDSQNQVSKNNPATMPQLQLCEAPFKDMPAH